MFKARISIGMKNWLEEASLSINVVKYDPDIKAQCQTSLQSVKYSTVIELSCLK